MCINRIKRGTICPLKLRQEMEMLQKLRDIDLAPPASSSPVYVDALAQSTELLKKILKKMSDFCKPIKTSKFYMILTHTTQPAHVIAMLSILLVAMILNPHSNSKAGAFDSFYTFLYLSTFAIHFGSQMWMTFVSGLSLYFNIPRHHFSEVQKVLFPRYFALNSLLGLLSLASYVRLTANRIETLQAIHIVVLVSSFLMELTVRLYLAPPLISLIDKKNKMEVASGCGKEIGSFKVTKELEANVVYIKTHKQFRKVHICIAIFNMLSISCSVAQLYLLNNFISFDVKI